LKIKVDLIGGGKTGPKSVSECKFIKCNKNIHLILYRNRIITLQCLLTVSQKSSTVFVNCDGIF